MGNAIAGGLLTPFRWLSRVVSTDAAAPPPPPVAMKGGEALCIICHDNVAPASTGHRCFDCWLDCNAAP